MSKQPGGDRRERRTTTAERVRPSMVVRLIRHAESRNNEVYRDARYIYRGGTPEFDQGGWNQYVDAHRSSDPGLSAVGQEQANALARFLVPNLFNQASYPVRVITSPMRRTLETIRPTLYGLQEKNPGAVLSRVLVHGFYFESEGCHTRDKAEEGMSPEEIKKLLEDHDCPPQDIQFVGFPDPDRGWYCQAQRAETRVESEARAAKFYLWLCEYLDQELEGDDVFDAGVLIPGEEGENEHDTSAPRKRRRRTALLVGHGDFMSLLLKRIVAGFGHWVEAEGIPHRSAFVHVNTGITELEYFGKGRFLVMGHNQTPHIRMEEQATLRSGGSLKDGWSYLMPDDEFILDNEVSIAFSDEMEYHVREQTEALRALYLSSSQSDQLSPDSNLSVEENAVENANHPQKANVKHFIVKRGLQVVGVATYSEETGRLYDVAVRPSAGNEVSETLFNAVKEHSKKLGRSGSLLVLPRTDESKELFQSLGFQEAPCTDESELVMEMKD